METKIRHLLIAALVLAACAAAAPAEIVRIGLTAEISYVDPYSQWLNENFKLGDIITGSYTYDTSAPDQNPSSAIGYYLFSEPPCGVVLNVNKFTFQTNPDAVDFRMGILNDDNSRDAYAFGSYNNVTNAAEVLLNHISLQLDDISGGALDVDALAMTAPTLADWQQPVGLTVEFGVRSGPLLRAHLTQLEVIPEPSTFILLGFGQLFLVRCLYAAAGSKRS